MEILYLKCKKTLIMSNGVEELTKNKVYKVTKDYSHIFDGRSSYYVLNNSGNPRHTMSEEFFRKHFYNELITKLYKL